MNKRIHRFLVFAAAALCSAAVEAGYYYEARTTTESEKGRGGETTLVAVWAEGDSARIEFQEGNDMGFMGEGSYMVTRDAGETLYIVNPEKQTYSEFDLGETMNFASEMMNAMGGLFEFRFGDFHVEKTGEEAGETILGYDTRKLSFKSGYTMTMSVMGRDMQQVVNMDKQMWTTEAIDAAAFNVWMRPDKRLKGMFEGLDEMMEAEFSHVDGVPLRAVIRTESTDQNGKQNVSIMTTEVLTLNEQGIDDERFAIPAGYTETPFMQEMTGQDNEEREQGLDKLKGLFKRKK